MPWRGPEVPGEYPTLGYQVLDWIEAHCVVPDGDRMGEPFILSEEQARFILAYYRLKPDAEQMDRSRAFYYRRAILVRPQKWGKGPLTAALILAEALGPVLFDGWDDQGEPKGRAWSTPWIQVAASSEDQTANVWRSLMPMVQEGPLNDVLPDTGLSRINLPGGGYIEPVTATGRSRLGQRITFAIHDETHSWLKENGGWNLADTQRRNLAGMGGRSVATTNAWNPAELSDAQRTAEAAMADVLIDFPPATGGSVNNKQERRKAIRIAYGDSIIQKGGWVDLDRIDAEIQELLAVGDAAQAERFYLNRVVATSDSYFPAEAWDQTRAEGPIHVPAGAKICLGFDGSQNDDWTAIRARWIDTENDRVVGFTPTFADGSKTIWNPADFGGEVPRHEVQAAVAELLEKYQVLRFYCDPELWQSEINEWALRHGEKTVLQWPTYRTRPMSGALERLRTDMMTGAIEHDGCEVTERHFKSARTVRRAGGVVVGKPNQHQKIDAAVADALAHEAYADAKAAGLTTRRKTRMRVF